MTTINISKETEFLVTHADNTESDVREKLTQLQPFIGFFDSVDDLPVGLDYTGKRAMTTEGIAINYAGEWIIPSLLTSVSNAGLMVVADEGIPIVAPTTSPYQLDRGWYYKNSSTSVDQDGNPATKINWYFAGEGYAKTLGDITTLGMNVNFFTLPTEGDVFLSIFTKYVGDGDDAGGWYRSKLNYLITPTQTGKQLVHFGQDIPTLLPSLPRLDITGNLDAVGSNGLQAPTEEIYLIALSTNSTAVTNTIELSLSSTFELYSNDAASGINIYRR